MVLASSSFDNVSIRINPAEVVNTVALTEFFPTKYRLSKHLDRLEHAGLRSVGQRLLQRWLA
jgi:hypothetical protein